jgi:hypothetical protein
MLNFGKYLKMMQSKTRFLGVIDEFSDLQIDLENEHDEE